MFSGKLERHTWHSLREKINLINPTLTAIIDDISPDESYPLYLVKYPYGSIILNKGIFQLPNKNDEIVSLYDSSISNSMREELDYNGTIPVGIVSSNSFESFMVTGSRIIPATLFGKGEILALWRVFDEGKSYQNGSFWTISSGARVICMLPKITDQNGYRLMKSKYKLSTDIPKNLLDHWHIFVHLASQKEYIPTWEAEIIYFSRKWFSHQHDKAWRLLYHYLLNYVWQESAFIRNKIMFDFVFSIVQENRNLKPDPYLADTVSHLMAIASGSSPAFAPATNNNAAPIEDLQKIFLNDYRLKKYAPVIMHMHHFCTGFKKPVYYSFQIPTTMLFSPRSNNALSTMAEMRELKHIISILLEEIGNGHLGVEKTPFQDLAQKCVFDFYHTEKDKSNEINLIENLESIDYSFTKVINNNHNFIFPEFSPFFKGCVRISHKEN